MGKKTIGLVTTWYPTKENQYNGFFFKEQAFAVKEYFDFTVIHYVEKKNNLALIYFFKKIIKKDYIIQHINAEENTIEYEVVVNYPMVFKIANGIANFNAQYIKKKNNPGIGRYTSDFYKRSKEKKVAKIFKENFKDKIDVLYCVNAQKESSTLMFASEALNVPYIIAEHAPFPWPGTVVDDLEHVAIKKADTFLAISQDKIRQVELQNIKLKNIEYIGNMIDENQFVLKTQENNIKTFLIVAANSFYKNYDLFIDVMNRLSEIASQPFKVKIVGYGANKGYSKNIEEFEEQIKTTRFADKTEMIKEISHDKIQEIYNKADAFIMTSIQEGQPVSAMEAACCGLPIFSTRCGGVEDYVDAEIGRVFGINDAQNFANTLNDFLNNKIVFDSKRIRKKVVSIFGKEAFANKFNYVFSNVLKDN